MARAAWSIVVKKRSVDAEGTAVISAELLDSGKVAATINATVTEERALRIEILQAKDAEPLSDFQAWMKVL